MTDRPRILLLDHTATLGGAELALLRLLVHLDRRRYDCRVLLFSEGPLIAKLKQLGVPVDVLPLDERVVATSRYEAGRALFRVGSVMATLRQIWRVARFIAANQIDLVHTHSLKSNFIGGFASRLTRLPCIWHLHIRLADEYMTPWVARVFRTLTRFVPNYVIANSESTLASVQLPDRVRSWVIYPGIQVAEFAGASDSTPAAGTRRTVGTIGRLSRTKGQDVFLRACARVLERHPNVRFQIVGSALFSDLAFEQELRLLAESLGIGEAVEFTGFVDDVATCMQNLDVFVLASTTPEPFGQIVVEAMSAGTPVIATDAGGVPEIITHGQNGLLVPPGDPERMADAICQLLAHPAETARMARQGRQRATERFTIERTAHEIETVYETILPRATNRSSSQPATVG